MGANVSYSVSKSQAYIIEFPEDETTLLKNVPGFSQFNDHVYFLSPTGFGVVKVPLSRPISTYITLRDNNFNLIVIGDVKESNWLTLFLISLVILGLAYYMYSKQKFSYAFLILLSILILYILFYSPKTSPDTTTTLDDALINFTLSSSNFTDLSRVAAQVSTNTFMRSQLQLGPETSTVPGLLNFSANETLEYVEIAPNTVTPLHTHSSQVHAVALCENLEYSFTGNDWKTWKKGQIILIPKNKTHAIRNIGQETGSILSAEEGGLTPLHDFQVA